MVESELERNTKEFNKFESRAAVFVAGETPAIVTETLCMLMRGECHSHIANDKPHKFMPTEIHIITTRGEKENGTGSFVRRWKDPGHLGIGAVLNCVREYGIDKISITLHFITNGADSAPEPWADSAKNIAAAGVNANDLKKWKYLKIHALNAQVPDDADNLADIRTDAENEAAGNYITRVLQQLARGDGSSERAIHISMAGGRKTMSGFTKGAAWLLGRAQDRLSHVLVDKSLEAQPNELPDWSRAKIGLEATRANRTKVKGAYLLPS